MPLGLPNPNAPAPAPTNRSGGRTRQTSQGNTAAGQQPAPAPFQPTPEYSNMGAWSGWDTKFDAPNEGNGFLRAGTNALDGIAAGFGRGTTQKDYYTNKYGADLVAQAMKSGMDPQTFFALPPATQQIAVQWGTNLPMARDIVGQQQQQYDLTQQQRTATNQYVDQFGALQDLNALNLQQQFEQGSAMAQGRFDMNKDHMTTNLYNDLGILGQQKFRSVDLAANDNRAALLHNANMRGVLDTTRDLTGQDFTRQQGYLNDQLGFLNQRQNLAYDQFQSSDQYAGQQARDLMAQYGFAGRQFAQTQEEAFANRDTQRRAATSDATARGAFSSAGFGDNIQDIHGQYGRTMDANVLQLDRTNQSIDERDREIGNQRQNLRFGYEGQQIGFAQDARGLNNAHDVNRIGTEGQYNQLRGQYSANDLQRANLENVNKGLASLAKEYGLREADLKNGFNQALDKMGLDLNETQQQLGQMLNSGNANLQAQAMSFMQQMMAYQ